jgi:hypothetical protein
MPRRIKAPPKAQETMMLNCSFESQVATWFMQGGWQVFSPTLDCGHKTDLIVSDGPSFYRIQIKTLATATKDTEVPNLWKDSDLDYVIYFAKGSNYWGWIIPAFTQSKMKLSNANGVRFQHSKTSFLKAFHTL